MSSLNAISLFSNCGAGDLGYRRAGFRFRVLAEIDQRRLVIAAGNHPGATPVVGDLARTWRDVVAAYRQRCGGATLHLLAACPPCQGMSSARSGRGAANDPDAGSRDTRNLLVLPIARVAHELLPRIVVVENVPAFLTRQVRDPRTKEGVSAALLLIRELDDYYDVFPFVADLAMFGVPQTRKRAFLTFVRRDEPRLELMRRIGVSPYPMPTHLNRNRKRRPVSLKLALKRLGLPRLDAASEEGARYLRLPLHRVPVWTDRRYPMVAAIPARSGGSAWDSEECETCGRVEVDEDDAVCPHCKEPLLRPVTKSTKGVFRLVRGFRSSSYRRMRPNRPAATITTASGHIGSDLTIHPWENRVLSPLECADLQTVPRSFKWGDSLEEWGHTKVREMIGEAVPPRFTRLHGKVLRWLLTGHPSVHPVRTHHEVCARAAHKLGLVPKVRKP